MIALLLTILTLYSSSPTHTITGVVANYETNEPIRDVHIFQNNSSFGTFSEEDGSFVLQISELALTDIVFSHIGFETRTLQLNNNQSQLNLDTIFLKPSTIDLASIVITGKKDKERKKNLKTFERSFLGSSKFGSHCKILNPEVLTFERNSTNQLICKALAAIEIENKDLGYKIFYQLENFQTDLNDNTSYGGKALFLEMKPKNKKEKSKWTSNRRKAHEHSMRFFFLSLINDRLNDDKLQMGISMLGSGSEFEFMGAATRSGVLNYDESQKVYKLNFREFLRIENGNIKIEDRRNLDARSMAILGRPSEGDLIQQSKDEINVKRTVAISYLFKIAPEIYLNEQGIVLNSKHIKEYGYWATLRVGDMLPHDYLVQIR